jgi:hypothetical protein
MLRPTKGRFAIVTTRGRGAVAAGGRKTYVRPAGRPKSRDPGDALASSLGIVVAAAERMPHSQGRGQMSAAVVTK